MLLGEDVLVEEVGAGYIWSLDVIRLGARTAREG
jgi:hypothetical protein